MANEGIAKWFGLRRSNFIIDPKKDTDLYAWRADISISSMVEDLQVNLVTQVAPKRLFWGIYGGGKTHTLFRIIKKLGELIPIYPVYAECPTVGKKSTFLHLYHDGIMASMGQDFVVNLFIELVNSIRAGGEQLISELKNILGDEDLARAAQPLIIADGAKKLSFWRFISGVSVPPRDLTDLGQTQALADAEPAKLADIIVVIGKILRRLRNQTLVLVLDELDRLYTITDDAAIQSFQDALRKLLDPPQNEVAILMGGSAVELKNLPEVFGTTGEKAGLGPVLSRLHEKNLIEIPGIEPNDFDIFVKEIIQYIRNPQIDVNQLVAKLQPETSEVLDTIFFPFTKQAMDALKGTVSRAIITPRDITYRMTLAAGKAYLMKKPVVTQDLIV